MKQGGGVLTWGVLLACGFQGYKSSRARLSVCNMNQSEKHFSSWLLGYNLLLVVACKLSWLHMMASGLRYQHWTFRWYILLYQGFCKLCFELYLILETWLKCFYSNNHVFSTTKSSFPLLLCLTSKAGYLLSCTKSSYATRPLFPTKNGTHLRKYNKWTSPSVDLTFQQKITYDLQPIKCNIPRRTQLSHIYVQDLVTFII
jgi:hypothetical protein